MGIESFFPSYLEENGKKFIHTGRSRISTCSFDMNSFIYNTFQESLLKNVTIDTMVEFHEGGSLKKEWKQFKLLFTTTMKMYLEMYTPEDAVYFAFDGPAPIAKIKQQRERRVGNDGPPRKTPKGKTPDDPNRNFSCFIVPGTNFMLQFHQFFEGELLPQLRRERLLPPVTLYSSCHEPGEAEHKIMTYYRELHKNSTSDAISEGGVHCVVSPDADLLMLAMLSPLENILFVRNNMKDEDNSTMFQVYNIEKAKTFVRTEHFLSPEEFVFLFFFFGNDFLPRQYMFKNNNRKHVKDTIKSFLDIYKEERQGQGATDVLVEKRKVNLKALKRLLRKYLAIESEELHTISQESDIRIFDNVYDVKKNAKLFSVKKFGNAIAEGPSSFFSVKHTTILQSFMDSDVHVDTYRRERDYWQMLQWNFLYYCSGDKKIDTRMYYPHSTAPLLSELLEFLTKGDNVKSKAYKEICNISFGMMEQMIASIPISGYKNNVPIHLYPLYDEISPIYDMTAVQTYHKDVHGNILVPPIDLLRIACCVKSLGELNNDLYDVRPLPMCLELRDEEVTQYTRNISRKGLQKDLRSAFPPSRNYTDRRGNTTDKSSSSSSSSSSSQAPKTMTFSKGNSSSSSRAPKTMTFSSSRGGKTRDNKRR